MELNYITDQFTAIVITLLISFIFIIFGFFYSKKFQGLNNYLVANRSVGTISLSTSLIASALGTWILFGPSSAATWGGMELLLVIISTAFLFLLIFLGKNLEMNIQIGKRF